MGHSGDGGQFPERGRGYDWMIEGRLGEFSDGGRAQHSQHFVLGLVKHVAHIAIGRAVAGVFACQASRHCGGAVNGLDDFKHRESGRGAAQLEATADARAGADEPGLHQMLENFGQVGFRRFRDDRDGSATDAAAFGESSHVSHDS